MRFVLALLPMVRPLAAEYVELGAGGTLLMNVPFACANSSTTVCWDGRDEHGRPALLGVYLCRLRSGGAFRRST